MDRDDIYSMLNSEPVCNQSSAIGHSSFEARAILVAPTFSRQSLFKLMFTSLSGDHLHNNLSPDKSPGEHLVQFLNRLEVFTFSDRNLLLQGMKRKN